MSLVVLLACSQKPEAIADSVTTWPDAGADGHTADVECDDADPDDCVLSGTRSLSEAILTGAVAADEAGGVLAAGGLSGDGQDDRLVGASDLLCGPNSDAVSLSAADLYPHRSLDPPALGQRTCCGARCRHGISDAVVAAPEDSTAGADAGSLYIVFGLGL